MSLPQPLYARVMKSESKISAAAGKFWKLDLTTHAGYWPANIWDALDDEAYPKKGDILKINKFKDQTDTKHGNIALKMSDIETITIEDIPENLRDEVVKIPKAPKGWVEKAWATLNYQGFYDDPKNLEFVQHCFAQYKTEDILKCPAAVSIHHHYHGGLVVHTSEVLMHAKSLVKSSNNSYKMVDNDVVVVSATLHDMGKMETYYLDELGIAQKNHTENSIGHFFYSMELINRTAKKHNIDNSFLNEVLHCVASHHGRVEYGSIKPVMSLEALIVSMADNLSSRCGIMDTKIREVLSSSNGTIKDWDFLKTRSETYLATNALKKYVPER